jgi:hypothetical protein
MHMARSSSGGHRRANASVYRRERCLPAGRRWLSRGARFSRQFRQIATTAPALDVPGSQHIVKRPVITPARVDFITDALVPDIG